MELSAVASSSTVNQRFSERALKLLKQATTCLRGKYDAADLLDPDEDSDLASRWLGAF